MSVSFAGVKFHQDVSGIFQFYSLHFVKSHYLLVISACNETVFLTVFPILRESKK